MKFIKIALTGGPSGGKTTVLESLRREYAKQVSIVAETASILYSGGFPRGKSPSEKMCVQRAIYFAQKELEELVRLANAKPGIICDRGSLDSVAYWPFPEDHFFTSVQSDKDTELKRYDWVIHLDTAPAGDYDLTNPIRTESFQEALLLNEKIKSAWEGHPQRVIIHGQNDFLTKMTLATSVVGAILQGKQNTEIQSLVFSSSK